MVQRAGKFLRHGTPPAEIMSLRRPGAAIALPCLMFSFGAMTMRMERMTACILLASSLLAADVQAKTMSEVLAASTPADWRTLDPANLLYMDTAVGRVIIELAPQFAPKHVDNIRALARENYFDGVSINRVQDNFVVQWGGADAKKPIVKAQTKLAPEFTRSSNGLAFTLLPDPDTYAPQTGFVDGFPAARDPATQTAWATHCYAMVGAGR